MPKDCKFGQGCTRYGCTFKHPTKRWGDCREGAACSRPDCRFQHPRAGGGAMVLHQDRVMVLHHDPVLDRDRKVTLSPEEERTLLFGTAFRWSRRPDG